MISFGQVVLRRISLIVVTTIEIMISIRQVTKEPND